MPKAFDFGEEPELPPVPVERPVAPKAFDFDEPPVVSTTPPKALSFDDLPEAPTLPKKAVPKPLFDSEDHPAVRDALSIACTNHPLVFEHSEQALAALFRRLLPVKLATVADWAETPLMEQAAALQPVIELVRKFSDMGVPALLEDALENAKGTTSVFGKLFVRTTPAEYKARLVSARAKLTQLVSDSEGASRNLEQAARELTLHWIALAVVSEQLGKAPDATLLDVLLQRRSLIQQAVRQAELSILQLGQVRQQAADLIGQVSSFLTVTLPALELARQK